MCTRAVVVAVGLLVGASQAHSQQSAPQIDQLMTAAEFRQAGLAKLTPEELSALNAWLAKFARAVNKTSAGAATSETTSATIESRVDGDFDGWEGETIFKLQNGQIWQQASYAYHYHYAYAPKVLIYKSGSGYMMRVDGIDQAIAVKRLK